MSEEESVARLTGVGGMADFFLLQNLHFHHPWRADSRRQAYAAQGSNSV
nr:hypothetical protein [Methylomarinum sp. Ch1-1]MDP4519353.1 hypothetical protein [Methylomarinum sp. Ch1-1]